MRQSVQFKVSISQWKQKNYLAVLFLLIFSVFDLSAITITSKPNGGNWNDPSTWINGIIPTSNDDVEIDGSWSSTVILQSNIVIKSLKLNSQANLNLNSYNLTIANNLQLIGNNKLTVNDSNLEIGGNLILNNFNAPDGIIRNLGVLTLKGNLIYANEWVTEGILGGGSQEGIFNFQGSSMTIYTNLTIPKLKQGNSSFTKIGVGTLKISNIFDRNCGPNPIISVGTFIVTGSTINSSCNSTPIINITPSNPSFSLFTYTIGNGPSNSQSYSISANNLTNNLIITPPIGYEISTDNLFSSIFINQTPLLLTPTNGVVTSKSIYIRLASGNIVNNYNGDIIHSSSGAQSISIPVSGNVVNSSSTTNTCNPICPNFTISNGGDNTTTSYNIINNGTGGHTFDFSHTVTSYQSSTASNAQVLGEARNPSAPLVLYNNDILFRGPEEVFHGLGYYGSSYGNPNPDKKRNFANTHIDGPVLYGFNGGALGVRQYEGFKTGSNDLTKQTEKVILQWTPNLVVIGKPNARVDLRVAGEIKCQELWVQPTTWYDNVFLPDYQLMSLDELRLFLSKHNHLPDIPSETTVKENGLAVAEYNALLLKKVEELTLYILQLEERISDLENQ